MILQFIKGKAQTKKNGYTATYGNDLFIHYLNSVGNLDVRKDRSKAKNLYWQSKSCTLQKMPIQSVRVTTYATPLRYKAKCNEVTPINNR